MSSKNTYSCTNGTLKDGSKTYTCPSNGKNCYPDSYTYCRKLSKDQERNLLIGGVSSLIIALLISALLAKIPIIGTLGALAINIALLLIIGGVCYIVYNNNKINPKHKE